MARGKKLKEATVKLESLLEDFGPFVDERVYENLQRMLEIARREWLRAIDPASEVGGGAEESFEDLRKEVFKAIADRLHEFSQYDRPPDEDTPD